MFPPLPHVSVHALGLTPYDVSRPMPHAPTPCHMPPHPATYPRALPHTPNPWPHPPCPQTQSKKTARGTPRALMQLSTSAHAALHKRSCSSPWALMQLSTSACGELHEQFAWAVCTTRKFFFVPHHHRGQQLQIISIMKNSGGVSPPPPNRITTPYSFPASQQADKEFTIQVNLHDWFARPEILVICSPPPLSAKSSNEFDYAKLCSGVPTTCKKN